MSIDQIYFARPLLSMSNYRTPIKGLYLCGSGTHPGRLSSRDDYQLSPRHVYVVPLRWWSYGSMWTQRRKRSTERLTKIKHNNEARTKEV